MRSAMTRQIVPRDSISPDGGAGRAGTGTEGTKGTVVGTSAANTAPPGPEPCSVARSRPHSIASRRALGEASILTPTPPPPPPPPPPTPRPTGGGGGRRGGGEVGG